MTGPAFGQRKIDNALVVQMSKHHRGSQALVRDAEQTGFFIRVSAQGSVSFGVAYTFNGRERRMSLGTYGARLLIRNKCVVCVQTALVLRKSRAGSRSGGPASIALLTVPSST